MANPTDERLQLLIDRIERLESEKRGISEDIKDVYGEAKSVGYDVKILRQVIKLRKMRADERQEMEAVLEAYMTALGME